MVSQRVVIISDQWTTTDLWSQNVKQHGTGVDLVDFGATSHYLKALSSYDLAIVDINDCDENGATVCRSLREISNIPLLVLTYDRDERAHLKFYGAGVDECIAKPIGPALLLAKIGAWLNRADVRNGGSAGSATVNNRLFAGIVGAN